MIAIIPARGGSKGLPGKNIKLLKGTPLIAYTIIAALNSPKITRVIVSTDCEKIAEIAINFGAEVPFMRPSELATDKAKSIDVLKYTINRLEKQEKINVSNLIVLQPTSPLRGTIHIDEAIDLFFKRNADSVISFCEDNHPIFWNKFISNCGKVEPIFDGSFLKNRQEIRLTYYPNGAIFIFNKKILFKSSYYTENSYAYIMEKKYSIDIDSQEDWDYMIYLIDNKQVLKHIG